VNIAAVIEQLGHADLLAKNSCNGHRCFPFLIMPAPLGSALPGLQIARYF
jgi:hypothetical protein